MVSIQIITQLKELFLEVDDKWSIHPSLLLQSYSPISEVQAQAWAGYKIKDETDDQMTLRFGVGGRLSDAAEVLLGLDWNDTRVALSYDVNLSQYQTATNTVGGFELAISHIFKVYKKPVVNPAILCPKL